MTDPARETHSLALVPAALVALAVSLGGCAGPLSTRAGTGPAPDDAGARAGWQALVEGRHGQAATAFRSVLARAPDDAFALFGDASLAFERGDSRRAVASYLRLLELGAKPPSANGPRGHDSPAPVAALASMAAGRMAVLLDELGGPEAERRAVEDRLLALSLTPSLSRLPWEARHDLAVILDRAARRRGDPHMLARAAEAYGCVRAFVVGRPAGILPHLDLDAPSGDSAPETSPRGRLARSIGCIGAVPSFEGRAGAQRVLADVEAPASGAYDVVLDFRGEARIIVDGGVAHHHGAEDEYGPRVSVAHLELARGRHRVELRLATFGGHPDLLLMFIPTAAAVAELALPDAASPSPSPSPSPPPDALAIAVELARGYVANRLEHAKLAWRAADRLERLPRFALGLAVAAVVARDDPSRPANFARDRARALFRAAVAVDPDLARCRHALAVIALDDDRPREAIEEALAATRSAPGWWIPEWTLHAAYRGRGLTWDADAMLDKATGHGAGACPVVEAALARAEDRHAIEEEKRWGAALDDACGKDSNEQIERLRRRGDLAGAEAALRRVIALAPERDEARASLASVLLARGHAGEAAALIAATVERGDSDGQLRLADAFLAAGQPNRARDTVAAMLAAHPELPEIIRAARALGLPLPLDSLRLDGLKVIRDFETSGRRYAAPAVVILDRTVARVFPGGAEMVLNHEIVRVQSKEAIEKWGEISVPERTEVLILRTHKADGSTREPEELAGKDTISAADLAIGDYVEKETLETRPPRDAFLVPATGAPGARAPADAPADLDGGFLGDRFYFQSFDAPLDRSEYLLVTTAEAARDLHFDRRAGAPEPTRTPLLSSSSPSPSSSSSSSSSPIVVTTFAAGNVPQLFAERSSVPPIEHVPSVRASLGVGWPAWTRFLREQLYGISRGAPALSRAAAEIRARSPDAQPASRAAALVAWVGQNIEADSDLRDPASFSAVRGRGNRLAVTLALARELGLVARPALARSRQTADGHAATPLEEADDFADPLVRFDLPGNQAVYGDPSLKHAPLGYLPPGLDGARVLILDRGEFDVAHSRADDHRNVDIVVHLDDRGGGVAEARETVRGWPALEWAEIVDRFGGDPTKLRQDFEQRWLGVQFPGAVLKDLQIDIVGTTTGRAGAPMVSDGRGQRDDRDQRGSAGGVGITEARAPAVPYLAGEVRLRYSFSSARLAVKGEREIRFLPTFFRSQPGRRYATESRRVTALLTGFDIPLDLHARVELPPGARLLERRSGAALSSPGTDVVSGQAGYRFFEERHGDRSMDAAVGAAGSAPEVLMLHRQARLPIMRVPLQEYPNLAAQLRRVDALEQEEVRIGIAPEHQ